MANSEINNFKLNFNCITRKDLDNYEGKEKQQLLSIFRQADQFEEDGITEGHDWKLTGNEINKFFNILKEKFGDTFGNKFNSWFGKYKEITNTYNLLKGYDSDNSKTLIYNKTNYDNAIKAINVNNVMEIISPNNKTRLELDDPFYNHLEDGKVLRNTEELRKDIEYVRSILKEYCKIHNINSIELDKKQFVESKEKLDSEFLIDQYVELINNSKDIININNIMRKNWHSELQNAINRKYEEVIKNGEELTIDTSKIENNVEKLLYEMADKGNGKIDRVAMQRTGNCWFHAELVALQSENFGKQFLENNFIKDEEKHLFAVHLLEAENKNLPKPNGDGIYVFTEAQVVRAQEGNDALSFGEGDITAYALAVEALQKETRLSNVEGDTGYRFYEMISGLEISNNDFGISSQNYREYPVSEELKEYDFDKMYTTKNEHGGAVSFSYNGHAYSVVGVDGKDLLIQESNQNDKWEQNAPFEKIPNSYPITYKLTKELYLKIGDGYSIFKWK